MERQTQEGILLNSLIQNLNAGQNSVLSPHLSCISAFIQSQISVIQDSESWDVFLLKTYDSLCLELEKLFVLVAEDAIDSSVLLS
jgi:hypothetical protein